MNDAALALDDRLAMRSCRLLCQNCSLLLNHEIFEMLDEFAVCQEAVCILLLAGIAGTDRHQVARGRLSVESEVHIHWTHNVCHPAAPAWSLHTDEFPHLLSGHATQFRQIRCRLRIRVGTHPFPQPNLPSSCHSVPPVKGIPHDVSALSNRADVLIF